MTKNRSIKIAVLVLALALITSCFVGTTFAKYTSNATGSDTVTVAKWQVSVNGTDVSASNSADPTFDLFKTSDNYDAGEATTDVADARVAPGTKGAFDLTVTNNSEVSAEYVVKFTAAFPAEFTADYIANRFVFKYGDQTLTADSNGVYTVVTDSIAYNAAEKTDTIKVNWEWTFAETPEANTADTAIGVAAQGADYVITITPDITVSQIN